MRRQIFRQFGSKVIALLVAGPLSLLLALGEPPAQARPKLLDPNLTVRMVVGGLTTPTSMAFLSAYDLLVVEKNTGLVKRVVDGALFGTVLDLPVNFASERGLLGIAVDPSFPAAPFVYLYWTQSSTGADTNVLTEVPLLGNRVDRFIWDGFHLIFDRNIVQIRALQADAGQTPRGNHNGGVLRFGPDGKLYIMIGDVGRRGWMQNLACGPRADCPGPSVPDDQFGGPEPDNAHLTGVILRLNADGTTPADNPFFSAGGAIGGEAGANIQKIFAYGIRNSFGMDFDPLSGALWTAENGDDSFDELNRVVPGFNSGWVQVMGPIRRVSQYRAIETSTEYFGLQQLRWPPTLIANKPKQVRSRLFGLPGSIYADPQFSWKFSVAPAAIGFMRGQGLGRRDEGALFVGAATTQARNGYLLRFKLSRDRTRLALPEPELGDRVADNAAKYDLGESSSQLIGAKFGVLTEILTGPNGNLFVVSLSDGAIYSISRL
jgi:aldose sugar dehydrogenase